MPYILGAVLFILDMIYFVVVQTNYAIARGN